MPKSYLTIIFEFLLKIKIKYARKKKLSLIKYYTMFSNHFILKGYFCEQKYYHISTSTKLQYNLKSKRQSLLHYQNDK